MKNNTRRNVWSIPAKIRTDKRVAIYCRVSTTRDSQADSLGIQKYWLVEIVENNPNWTLYGIYEDQDSSDNTNRWGFETAESKIYARKCFGYKHNEEGELIINEEQAIVVRVIFELFLKEDESAPRIDESMV